MFSINLSAFLFTGFPGLRVSSYVSSQCCHGVSAAQRLTSSKILWFLIVCWHSFSGPFRDCLQAQEAGHSTSGMYLIKPDEADRPMQVWCEQDIDGGGWTVIQSRRDGSVNFFRNWDNYKVMTDNKTLLLPRLFYLSSLSLTLYLLFNLSTRNSGTVI